MGDPADSRESGEPPPLAAVTLPPGDERHREAVWRCKERIRRREGVLVQQRAFFEYQYRRSTVYLSLVGSPEDANAAGSHGSAVPNAGSTATGEDRSAAPGPGSDAAGSDRSAPSDADRSGAAGELSAASSGTRPDTDRDRVAGFALVRADGYLSLLGVAPGHRRQGLGSRLLERAVADHEELTCHVRATNRPALAFYADHGFAVEGREPGYYRDGADAFLLERDPQRADRFAELL